ncbi:protealysin inhibitor emfourin [Fodinicola acaciae]|uniref:protealysin inhibitor emfourin n=1 Tax=Fodinicola acaciae TaxID=2681555 RepID=UPI0013D54AC3|nr:protealysin inhibitor emfourin [Fodinicola acaciae]
MKITVVRTGGMAGLRLERSADTADDPELAGLVERAGLTPIDQPDGPPRAAGLVPGYADRYTYEISTDDGRHHTAGETQLSEPQRTLVDRIMKS